MCATITQLCSQTTCNMICIAITAAAYAAMSLPVAKSRRTPGRRPWAAFTSSVCAVTVEQAL
jgi:hypothetical protein